MHFKVRDVYPSFPKDFKSFVKYGNWFGLDFPTGIIGHFTQLVWHSTYNVGCGFVQTKDPKNADWTISVSFKISIFNFKTFSLF